jgi:hypothetical protein
MSFPLDNDECNKGRRKISSSSKHVASRRLLVHRVVGVGKVAVKKVNRELPRKSGNFIKHKKSSTASGARKSLLTISYKNCQFAAGKDKLEVSAKHEKLFYYHDYVVQVT